MGTSPKNGGTAIVIPIHKKGERNNPDNYRGISLLNTGYKIYKCAVCAQRRISERVNLTVHIITTGL